MIRQLFRLLAILGSVFIGSSALAGDPAFNALVTDTQGVETEVKKVRLYWEEKLDETTFVPHELTYVPVKRGATTVNVKFQTIKTIDVKGDHHPAKVNHVLTITLNNSKAGEFPLAREVSLIGESDFGDIKIPMKEVKKIVFK